MFLNYLCNTDQVLPLSKGSVDKNQSQRKLSAVRFWCDIQHVRGASYFSTADVRRTLTKGVHGRNIGGVGVVLRVVS
jgi:hypothetical protein